MKTSKSNAELVQLHADVDEAAEGLAQRLRSRLQCKQGCTHCCIDELSVFEVEAERIRAEHAELLQTGAPAPEGGCAFLGDGGRCRIYESRPYVCRTQGLPLRWWEEGPDGVSEHRDICGLNEVGEPSLVALSPSDCWTVGPFEGRLAQLEAERSGGKLHRVRLRDLFARAAPHEKGC